MEKVSKYNIEVEHTDCMLLYNALTDALLPVSFKDYAVIETLMEHLTEFSNRFPMLYSAFLKSGLIVDQAFDESAYIKLQNIRRVYTHNDYRITINPTLDCNLKCWYCSVSSAGAKHNRERMSDETVDALNRHLQHLVFNQQVNSIMLDWFGGEPLMYFDEVIQKVSNFLKTVAFEKNVIFNQIITTNATLLNEERIRQMKDWNFIFFQIPIDGNERRHNKIKSFDNKQGTYRKVIENVNLLSEIIPNINITIRINYDKQTFKNLREILSDFTEHSKKCITIDFQRVWQVPITDEERELLKELKEYFRQSGLRSGFWAYNPKRFHRCYADSFHYYAINYNGKVFKCTARDYEDDKVIGRLQPSGAIEWNDALLCKLFEKATFENELCENCKILPLCMGPCIQKNYEARLKNVQIPCIYKNVEYKLSDFIIERARKRNLIQ